MGLELFSLRYGGLFFRGEQFLEGSRAFSPKHARGFRQGSRRRSAGHQRAGWGLAKAPDMATPWPSREERHHILARLCPDS